MAVDVGINVEELGPQLHLANIFKTQDLAVGILFQNDACILLRLVEAPAIGQHVLFRLRRLPCGLPESSRRADHALLRDRLHDILAGYVVGAHAVRIEPHPHRIDAVAEVPGNAHAFDPLEPRHDIDIGKVEQVFLVGAWVLAEDVHVHQHARHDLADKYSLSDHQRRELEQHDVDPILHVYDVNVWIRARLEIDDDRRLTGTGRGRGNEPHILDAVDGLLQRNQDRFDQHIGAGAGIRNGNHDRRRRNVGELCDREGLDSQHPQE